MRAQKNILPADKAYPLNGIVSHNDDAWVWTRLTDDHLEMCLQDFVWLSRYGDVKARPACTATREQIAAECLRRGRHDIERRAWLAVAEVR